MIDNQRKISGIFHSTSKNDLAGVAAFFFWRYSESGCLEIGFVRKLKHTVNKVLSLWDKTPLAKYSASKKEIIGVAVQGKP